MYAAPFDAGFTRPDCTLLSGIRLSWRKLFRNTEAAVEGLGHAPKHGLDLLIGSDALQAFLTAETAVFAPSERSRR